MLLLFLVLTLMVEATRVIELRLRMIVLGKSTPGEMLLMMTEKVDATEKAKAIIISGRNPPLATTGRLSRQMLRACQT